MALGCCIGSMRVHGYFCCNKHASRSSRITTFPYNCDMDWSCNTMILQVYERRMMAMSAMHVAWSAVVDCRGATDSASVSTRYAQERTCFDSLLVIC